MPTTKRKKPRRVRLQRSNYAKAGLFRFREIWTHGRGDDHAEKIISGEIPFEQAVVEIDHEPERTSPIIREVFPGFSIIERHSTDGFGAPINGGRYQRKGR